MSTNAVASSPGVRTLEELNSRKPASTLDKNAFLALLVAQLAHQNPLEPSGDTEFIAQLAQFSALEQMQSLNQASVTSQAYNLIGKYAYVLKESGNPNSSLVFGRVDGVVREDGVDYLIIGDGKYKLTDVTGVIDSAAAEGSTEEQVLQSASLIGKTITAVITENEEEVTVTGTVSKITIKDGVIYAKVGEREIPLSCITEIQNSDL